MDFGLQFQSSSLYKPYLLREKLTYIHTYKNIFISVNCQLACTGKHLMLFGTSGRHPFVHMNVFTSLWASKISMERSNEC